MVELDQRLLIEAIRHLRKTENIRDALSWIRRNPQGFRIRVAEFESIIDEMNFFILGRATDKGRYGSVEAIRALLGEGEAIFTPTEFVSLYDDWKETGEYEETGEALEGFFPKIHGIISTRLWEFPTAIVDNPNKLASGLLIEGFGQLIEDHYHKPGLARRFVLGFEEMLITLAPESKLLADVFDWMVEEKDDFSPAVRLEIEERLLWQR